MRVLAVVDDLVFQSKIQGAAAPGVEVRIAKTLAPAQAASSEAVIVIIDLGLGSADPMEIIRTLHAQHPAVTIIGYGSHVETELLAQAKIAGCTTVLPRSALVQQLLHLLVPRQLK